MTKVVLLCISAPLGVSFPFSTTFHVGRRLDSSPRVLLIRA
jgi:hypothetical protein